MSGTATIIVRPIDPNDKLSPDGVGPNRVVPLADEIEYTIRFENFATASAPVQELVVVDYLDPALDWTTVRFKEVAYGGRILNPPADPGSAGFALRDIPPANSPAVAGTGAASMVVDVTSSRNVQAGRLEWRLTAVDTNTLTFPLDALTGFLPPENGTGRGNGHVRFGVRPRADLAIGTLITNVASIDFGGNEPIRTPVVWNRVGDIPSLAISMAYAPGEIAVGQTFAYHLDLTNTSTSAIPRVVLTNLPPATLTGIAASSDQGTVSVTDGVVVWDVGTLLPGATVRLSVRARATEEGEFENRVEYTGGSGIAVYSAPSQIRVVAVLRPELGIRRDGTNLELHWPASAVGYRLESTSDSEEPWAWSPVPFTPATVGDQQVVPVQSDTATRLYRLRKQ